MGHRTTELAARVAVILLSSCVSVLIGPPSIANAAVQRLLVTEAVLRAAGPATGNVGRLQARAAVADEDGSARAALLANQVVVDIDDRASFHVSSPITGCRQRHHGRIVCRSASRTARVLCTPSQQEPGQVAVKICCADFPRPIPARHYPPDR